MAPKSGLVYVYNTDIKKCIEHCIKLIDQDTALQSYNIVYVNCTIPTDLFNMIDTLPIQFKNNESVMKSFHYHKANSLQDLQQLISSQTSDFVMIIESIDQLAKLTNLNYTEVNSLLSRILLMLKRNKMSLLLDRYCNSYIEYFVNDVYEI
ncbi:unnamed protein product [Debaryomyces fabryi]|nr:unnamed protein product [Debaryomyces fabryi]